MGYTLRSENNLVIARRRSRRVVWRFRHGETGQSGMAAIAQLLAFWIA
jgi:hypothetical protein